MTRGGRGPAQRLPRRSRIRRRQEYVVLQRDGRRRTTPHFVLVWRPRSDGGSRLGLTVSRKVGGAVLRNRVKRWVREWFRRHRTLVMPVQDVVVIARPGAAEIGYLEVATELARALRIQ
ncbi:MAG: ribonuclease P protein component [Deltaproteobacteria bacterium]|nr:ribonuclease P protein component [Deltaproteobacteria bacterium]